MSTDVQIFETTPQKLVCLEDVLFRVEKSLLGQGCPGANPSGSCRYNAEGKHCVIGWLAIHSQFPLPAENMYGIPRSSSDFFETPAWLAYAARHWWISYNYSAVVVLQVLTKLQQLHDDLVFASPLTFEMRVEAMFEEIYKDYPKLRT